MIKGEDQSKLNCAIDFISSKNIIDDLDKFIETIKSFNFDAEVNRYECCVDIDFEDLTNYSGYTLFIHVELLKFDDKYTLDSFMIVKDDD